MTCSGSPSAFFSPIEFDLLQRGKELSLATESFVQGLLEPLERMPGKVHVYHDPVEVADSGAKASKKRKKKSNGGKVQSKAKRKRSAVAPLDDVSNRVTRQRTSKAKVAPVISASTSSASSVPPFSEEARAQVRRSLPGNFPAPRAGPVTHNLCPLPPPLTCFHQQRRWMPQ